MRLTGSVRAALRRRDGDSGSTMVAVIGVSAVVAVLLLALVSTVIFSIGQTTAARASVGARSVAEAAMENVAAQVAGGVCPVGGTASSTSPKWRVQVQRLTSNTADPALESSWVNGCPTAAPPEAAVGNPFRVIATGTTVARGTGNTTGNVRTMVGQFTVKQRPMSPEFNAAIFGKVTTSASTDLRVNGAGADVLSDKLTCSTFMVVDGNMMINAPSTADVSMLNTQCMIKGDFVTKGSLQCPSQGQILGDAVVAGNVTWNTVCKVGGDMWVGGNFTCPSMGEIGGDLTVVGNATFSSSCKVGGNIYVGGDLSTSIPLTYPGNVWVKGRLIGNANTITSTGGTIRVGTAGGVPKTQLVPQPATFPDPSLPAPPVPNMNTYFPPTSPSLNFPKVTSADSRWNGWIMRRWKDDLNALKKSSYSWVDVCSVSSADAVFTGPLNVTTPTIYDLRLATGSGGCGSSSSVGLGGQLTIRLSADMVMFVPGAQFRTGFRVESADGAKHTLYVIEAWPTGMSTCTSPVGTLRGINLAAWGSPTINQGPNTSVMLYTPGSITANGDMTLTGQLYGCKVELARIVNLNFSAANAGSGSSGRLYAVTEKFRFDKQSAALY